MSGPLSKLGKVEKSRPRSGALTSQAVSTTSNGFRFWPKKWQERYQNQFGKWRTGCGETDNRQSTRKSRYKYDRSGYKGGGRQVAVRWYPLGAPSSVLCVTPVGRFGFLFFVESAIILWWFPVESPSSGIRNRVFCFAVFAGILPIFPSAPCFTRRRDAYECFLCECPIFTQRIRMFSGTENRLF